VVEEAGSEAGKGEEAVAHIQAHQRNKDGIF
jgi:hypothetical protein